MNEKFLNDVLEAVQFYTKHFPDGVPLDALDDITVDGRYATRREVRGALHELAKRGRVEVEGSGRDAETRLANGAEAKNSAGGAKRAASSKTTRAKARKAPRSANPDRYPEDRFPSSWTPRVSLASMGYPYKTATVNAESLEKFDADMEKIEKKNPFLEWEIADYEGIPRDIRLRSWTDAREYAEFWDILQNEMPHIFNGNKADAEQAIAAFWQASRKYDGVLDAIERYNGAVGTPADYAGRLADDAGGLCALLGDRIDYYIDWNNLGEQLLRESENEPGGDTVINGHLFRHS